MSYKNEFKKIVNSVAENTSNICDWNVNDTTVNVTFHSRSKKSKWDAVLKFDNDGDFKYNTGQCSAGAPQIFGNKIKNSIKDTFGNND